MEQLESNQSEIIDEEDRIIVLPLDQVVKIVPYAGTESVLDGPKTPQEPNPYWANMIA